MATSHRGPETGERCRSIHWARVTGRSDPEVPLSVTPGISTCSLARGGRVGAGRLSSYACEIRKEDTHDSGDLDELDRAIVSQLMEDGRRPFRTIAQSLGVPESTVRFRANRLRREGILNIVAMANPHRLGYAILAVILLRVRPKARARVIEALEKLPEVQYLSSCAGRVDLVLQVVCRDQEDLRRLLAERFPALGGILESETLLELEVHKFKYAYPNLAGQPR